MLLTQKSKKRDTDLFTQLRKIHLSRAITRFLITRLYFPMKPAVLPFSVVFLVFLSQFATGIRNIPLRIAAVSNGFDIEHFVEAPEYRNGKECASQSSNRENFVSSCDPSLVHIYEFGSLPPFLLVFARDVEAIDHRWNQHGLGGDSVRGSCRSLHKGVVSLLHWSGKGKPWVRLDEKRPCPLDHLWEPYDLYEHKIDRAKDQAFFGFSSLSELAEASSFL